MTLCLWYNVLGKSSGLEDVGTIQWHLVVCLLVGWTLSFFCLSKGIKTVGKVVYVTAILPYFLLTILLVRAVTLDGAADGLSWFLEVDLSRMLHGQIWIESAVQVFYSLGTAGGCVITMASFNKFNHNILRDTIIVCVADFFTAIYGAIIVFSVVGFLAKDMGIAKESVDFSGPGLAFIAYPAALSRLPIPHFWSVLFFLTLVLLGLDTQFATFETVVNAIIDMRYSTLHKYRTYITATLIGIFCLAGLPFCFSNGIFIFNLLDWYMLTFSITFVGFIEMVAVCWLYGSNRLCDDIYTMIGVRTPLAVRLSWAIVAPLFMGAIFLMTVFSHTAPTGDYSYPTYAVIFGNILAIGPMVLTVGMAVHEILRRKGSLRKRLVAATRPADTWEPNDNYQAAIFTSGPYLYEPSFLKRIAVDVLGFKKK